jgi:hypothetical protein
LQLAPVVLTELAEALSEAGPEPRRIVREHFIVYPVETPPRDTAHTQGAVQAD